jgi:hypothetical protein
MDKKIAVITGITFSVFMAEALIHYNYGILETIDNKFTMDTFLKNFKVPTGVSFLKMASIVAVASILSSELISLAEKNL